MVADVQRSAQLASPREETAPAKDRPKSAGRAAFHPRNPAFAARVPGRAGRTEPLAVGAAPQATGMLWKGLRGPSLPQVRPEN